MPPTFKKQKNISKCLPIYFNKVLLSANNVLEMLKHLIRKPHDYKMMDVILITLIDQLLFIFAAMVDFNVHLPAAEKPYPFLCIY